MIITINTKSNCSLRCLLNDHYIIIVVNRQDKDPFLSALFPQPVLILLH